MKKTKTQGVGPNFDKPIRELTGLERLSYEARCRLPMTIFPEKIIRYYTPDAFLLNLHRLIKRGRRARVAEATVMDFLANNTTIPVARVYDVFKYKGVTHIVQEFINHPVLEDVWPRMSTEDRLKSVHELKGYLDQLRNLTPPDPDKVQGFDGGGCLDDRLERHGGIWGPFPSHTAFINHFGYDMLRDDPDTYPDAREPVAKIQGRKWRTVLSHGDLGPHNILWNVKEKRIAAIIDWESAGWLPEYWDYCRSASLCTLRSSSWWEIFDQVVDRYPDEWEVERLLDSYLTRINA